MSLAQPSQTLGHAVPGSSTRQSWTGVLHAWTTTVDHKQIGIMYVLMSLVFLVIGGAEAMLMRWQIGRAHV